MAIYSMHVSNVSRAAGSSAVACVSYITSRPMADERTGERYWGFGRRERVELVGVALPAGASRSWADPAVLANAMEAAEKRADGRPAKKIMVALPRELPNAQQARAVEAFVGRCLTARGYAAVWAIHTDKDGRNPHAHIIVANRRLGTNGKWLAKSRSMFALDGHGQRIPVIDPATGEQKRRANGRLVWKRTTISDNPLDSVEELKYMRAQWADTCNRLLPQGVSIDHRTLEAQGVDRLPTIHEGYAAREIEQRGGLSPLCEENRRIRQTNRLLARLHAELAGLKSKLANLMHQLTHGHHTGTEPTQTQTGRPQQTPTERTREELLTRFKADSEARWQETPRPARRARGHTSRPQQTPDPMTEARRRLEAARDRAVEEATQAYLDADRAYRCEADRLQTADPASWPAIRAHTTPMRDAMQAAEHAGILRRHKLRRQAAQTTAEHFESLRADTPWLHLPGQPPQDTTGLRRLEDDLHAQAMNHDLRPYKAERAHARERLDQARTQPITNTDIRDLADQITYEQAEPKPAAETRHTDTPPRARTTGQPEQTPEPAKDTFPPDWGLDDTNNTGRHHGMRR